MRKFTVLFLLALAMTVGASQSFARQAGGPNDKGGRETASSRDISNDGNDREFGIVRIPPCLTAANCRPPRRLTPVVVREERDDCKCQTRTMRVGARFVVVRDCYQPILINGRQSVEYCTNE